MAGVLIDRPETLIHAGLLGARVSGLLDDSDQIVNQRLYEIERLLLALCAVHGLKWEDGVLSRDAAKLLPIDMNA